MISRIQNKLASLKEASIWASGFLKREISVSNISYLVQYGKIKKYEKNGSVFINLHDLKKYYDSYHGKRELNWKKKLGDDLNWALSFDHLREKDTTKHVHRLHPYKGKFIPQLVEYFIDNHTDQYKTKPFFKKGDIILDPFAGSGTTLVQANELGIHSIGIDISKFNCIISEAKLLDYDFKKLDHEIQNLLRHISHFETDNNIKPFDRELMNELKLFNNEYFPSPTFKYQVNKKQINEDHYSKEKTDEFSKLYNYLAIKYRISLEQSSNNTFLDRWFIDNVRKEIDFAFEKIKNSKDINCKKILSIILSRTIRSCRATTHSDLNAV